jgi:mannose-6-phosphate isomerase-like protein (cupin superfamily)
VASIRKVDMTSNALDIRKVDSDWSLATRAVQPGPPERVDGMSVGIVTMTGDAPHGGEVHPDGDEFLYVSAGKLAVTCDSSPEAIEVGPGEGCIVPQGEWHKVSILEPTQLLHMTPGPNGDHRPL